MVDIPGDTGTTAVFPQPVYSGASFGSDFEVSGDQDAVQIQLTAGVTYSFYAHVDTGAGAHAAFALVDFVGRPVANSFSGGVGQNAFFTATISITATYFVAILDIANGVGSWSIDVTGVAATNHLLTTGDDTYTGAAGERILGGSGNDTLAIGAGLDALGEQGNDVITGNGLDNFISGGTGVDTIHGGDGNDALFGDSGNDTVDGGNGADRIYGGDGSDDLYGGALSTITGDAGGNQIHGGDGDDRIAGSDGQDSLWGDDGNDILLGGAGADKLVGGAGADAMWGGSGDDTYYVYDAGDVVNESRTAPGVFTPAGGIDKVYSIVTLDLSDSSHVVGDVETLVLNGTVAIDGTGNALDNSLTGNNAVNHLSGLDGRDRLDGRGGNDILDGGAGNDTLIGGAGDDVLTGGTGGDRLLGGAGADSFVFRSLAESTMSTANRDWIVDFNAAEGDRIDLSAFDADSTLDGQQHFTFIGTESFTRHAGELRYRVIGDKLYLYGDTNGDARFDFSVIVDKTAVLHADDFLLGSG